MPKHYFQFKEFTIFQDRCALKVSTDSCIFGAWIAGRTALCTHHLSSCLDIGAGSGLLMLMLAQQFAGAIDGVEIDQPSYEQAMENIAGTAWHNRLRIFHHDVKLFSLPHRYDLVISNPPFYEGDLKSASTRQNYARHDEGLTLSDLLAVAERNLSDKGKLAVLLPYQRSMYFEQLAAHYGLYVSDKLSVRQSLKHPFSRAVLLLHRLNDGLLHTEELLIRQSPETYSPAFTALLKPYYLYL